MKKPHACKVNDWEVMRLGADIRLKCLGCGRMLMMPRGDFNKKMKKVLYKANDPVNTKKEYYISKDQLAGPKLSK